MHKKIPKIRFLLFFIISFSAFGGIVKAENFGKIIIHKRISYDGLLARDIEVYLPPNYENELKSRYPVLYIQDGQVIFNSTLSPGESWRLNETADSLILAGYIKPVIIVGINSTNERELEYSVSPKGEFYMEFITTKVKPFIDSTYRTMANRENTAIGGSSLGGFISFLLAWKYPNCFSKVVCLSPFFGINKQDFVSAIKNIKHEKKSLLIYIDNADKGLDIALQPGIDKLISFLKDKNYEKNIDYFWFPVQNGSHSNKSWGSRIKKPLRIFYKISK